MQPAAFAVHQRAVAIAVVTRQMLVALDILSLTHTMLIIKGTGNYLPQLIIALATPMIIGDY
jgi:hypothetical protein